MSNDRASEQILEAGTDTLMFLIEGISGLLGTENMTSHEKGILETKLNQVLSSFMNDGNKEVFGNMTIEDLKNKLNMDDNDIEKITLPSDKIPDFQKGAEAEKLNYSVTTVKSSSNDITMISFPKKDISKMTNICLAIAKKSLDKKKEPVNKKLDKTKQQQQEQQKQKVKVKNKNMER